jgi:DNA polymerase-3 subunit delta'
MPFSDFHGNHHTVTRIREMLTRDRFPHAVILSGPPGSGKFTLAQMIAKAMNCLNLQRPSTDQPTLGLLPAEPSETAPPDDSAQLIDFCGHCESCLRIAEADDLAARFNEAVEARDALRETDKKETRIFVQTHPEVLIIPPDPPQLMIKVDQIRHVIGTIYHRPGVHGRRVYIFTDSAFMKEAANSLLKILEEPPDFATLLLLTDNPGELLPTIRSRCVTFALSPLTVAEIEEYLKQQRPDWKPAQRSLVARLSGGAIGRARTFDLASYEASRNDALTLLTTAIRADDHSSLFRTTETYRAGADGREKTDRLLRSLYSLLEDLMFIKSGTPELVRNTDIHSDLTSLASKLDFAWITDATQRIGEVESGMRRNLLRNVSLDAFVASMEK